MEYIIILVFATLIVTVFVGPKLGTAIVNEYIGRRVILYLGSMP